MLLLSSTVVFAQNRNQVPNSVRQSFQRDYPTVNNAQWNQKNGQWHANYKDNSNRDVDSYYDRNGRRVDTHIAWDRKDVPPQVDNRINSRYHANGNYKAYRIERPKAQPLFQIRIGTKQPVYMDEQGRQRKYYDHH